MTCPRCVENDDEVRELRDQLVNAVQTINELYLCIDGLERKLIAARGY